MPRNVTSLAILLQVFGGLCAGQIPRDVDRGEHGDRPVPSVDRLDGRPGYGRAVDGLRARVKRLACPTVQTAKSGNHVTG